MKCDVNPVTDHMAERTILMQANTHLSIVIPTYNRAEILDYCLEVHIPLVRAHNIQLFISDNASTDTTAAVVKKRIKEYPLIQYHRNETNVGPDANFELALKCPKTQYVWLLGDSHQIPSDGIEYILGLITANNEKYDVIVFNAARRVFDIPQQNYSDQNKLLSDLGWHMTCMSCLVYSLQLIATANFRRYHGTYFIHLGIIFEAISNNKFIVHWGQDKSIQSITLKNVLKYSWQDQTFDIWVKKWGNFIFSLPPSYDLDIKLKCIKDHGIKSGLFTLKRLLSLRSFNILNYKIYKKYSHLFPLTIKLPIFVILIIALVPHGILRALKAIKRFGSSRKCVHGSR